MPHKQYFVSKEVMRQRFAGIIEDDPAMSKETAFHDVLLEFAGKETNSQHAVLIIVNALGKITRKRAINLSRYAEAILDDPGTIAAVKAILENVAVRMARAEMLKIPDFPFNSMGIQRGTVIRSNDILVERQLGIKIGEKIPVGFDGEYVRCGPFTWSIDQLMDEIDYGCWVIDGLVDLSNPLVSLGFAEKVEQLDIPDIIH